MFCVDVGRSEGSGLCVTCVNLLPTEHGEAVTRRLGAWRRSGLYFTKVGIKNVLQPVWRSARHPLGLASSTHFTFPHKLHPQEPTCKTFVFHLALVSTKLMGEKRSVNGVPNVTVT